MKDSVTRIYIKMIRLGHKAGCHQRPDRSFFYKGHQFPVCARCTGVLIGYFLSLFLLPIWKGNFLLCIALAGIMFLDWLVQYLNILESTNIRRLITGVLGGYAVLTFQILLIRSVMAGFRNILGGSI